MEKTRGNLIKSNLFPFHFYFLSPESETYQVCFGEVGLLHSTPPKVKLIFDKIMAVWEDWRRGARYTQAAGLLNGKRRLLKTFRYTYVKALSTCELKQMKMSLTKERLECAAGRRFMNVCVFI